MTVKLLTEQHLEFLCLNRGCTGSCESTLFKMPHCWKSSVAAQMSHLNAHTDDSSRSRGYNCRLCLHLYPYIVSVSGDGSGETTPMHMLV